MLRIRPLQFNSRKISFSKKKKLGFHRKPEFLRNLRLEVYYQTREKNFISSRKKVSICVWHFNLNYYLLYKLSICVGTLNLFKLCGGLAGSEAPSHTRYR